jgi:hypothetical protein
MRTKGVTETGSNWDGLGTGRMKHKQLTHRILNSGQQWVWKRGWMFLLGFVLFGYLYYPQSVRGKKQTK